MHEQAEETVGALASADSTRPYIVTATAGSAGETWTRISTWEGRDVARHAQPDAARSGHRLSVPESVTAGGAFALAAIWAASMTPDLGRHRHQSDTCRSGV